MVFIHTNNFREDLPQYWKNTIVQFPIPTSDTLEIVEYALAGLKNIFMEGAPVNTHRNYLYCCIIASMGTGYPVDFFAGLPLCEAVKLRDAVNSDFFE